MTELPSPEEVEGHRRSVAMLSVGQPALNREQALTVLHQLHDAVDELRRRDRRRIRGRSHGYARRLMLRGLSTGGRSA